VLGRSRVAAGSGPNRPRFGAVTTRYKIALNIYPNNLILTLKRGQLSLSSRNIKKSNFSVVGKVLTIIHENKKANRLIYNASTKVIATYTASSLKLKLYNTLLKVLPWICISLYSY